MNLHLLEAGSKLSIRNGMLRIDRQERESLRFSLNDIQRIYLGRRCLISTEVLFLAMEQEIEILFIDKKGKHYGSLYSESYRNKGQLRKAQARFHESPEAVQWVKALTQQKMEQQILLLHAFEAWTAEEQAIVDKAKAGIQRSVNRISAINSANLAQVCGSLRGMEGTGSAHYFKGLNACLPPFYRFAQRSQHPALDPFNAMLNYGYGMLYGLVEAALLKAGLDPALGILHADSYGKPVLAFDVIEIFRWWVDYPLLELARAELLDESFFVQHPDRCELEPTTRKTLIQCIQGFLSEVIELDGLSRKREQHIQQYAWQLAQKITNT